MIRVNISVFVCIKFVLQTNESMTIAWIILLHGLLVGFACHSQHVGQFPKAIPEGQLLSFDEQVYRQCALDYPICPTPAVCHPHQVRIQSKNYQEDGDKQLTLASIFFGQTTWI